MNRLTFFAFAFGFVPLIANGQELDFNKLPFTKQQLEKANQDVEKREAVLRKLRSNGQIVQLILAGQKEPKILEMLELVDEQKDELREIIDGFQNKKLDIENSEKTARQKRREILVLGIETRDNILGVLLDFQLEPLAEMNVFANSIPKMLTDTVVGKTLGITEQQKKNIRARSDKLAKDAEESLKQFRSKAMKVVFDELSDDQKKLFLTIYDPVSVRKAFESQTLTSIVPKYSYSGQDSGMNPALKILETENKELRKEIERLTKAKK